MKMMTGKKNTGTDRQDKIKGLLDILPRKAGVYIFKDLKGKILYIGKAKNLRDRVRSYFQNRGENVFYMKPPDFMEKITSIDYVVTDNETEALILEGTLIKKNRPKYNIELKDDKSYPFIVITAGETYPRVFLTREKNIKGAEYFGPYTNAAAVRKTLKYLRRIFKVRDCRKSTPGKGSKNPCLNYHINICQAPCIGNISEGEYKKNIGFIKMFLTGKDKTIIDRLKSKMGEYSEKKEFEKAADLKKKIDDIGKLDSRQKVFLPGEIKWDFISSSRGGKEAVISMFTYRDGALSIISNFTVYNIEYLDDREIMTGFIERYYSGLSDIPSKIYCSLKLEDAYMLSKWLTKKKGKKVEMIVPKIGEKKKIMEMVTRNSKLYLEKKRFEKDTGHSDFYKESMKLKNILGLVNIPRRIECFDISNLKDTFPVGSMSVSVDGKLENRDYRYFKIKTVAGQDDCRMIEEVAGRRLRHLQNKRASRKNSFSIKPDLMVIDGGKPQFNTVSRLMEKERITDIDVISVAKKEEIIFCARYPDGIKLDLDKNYMRVLIKIRDEAHRFAVNFHRKLRDKNMTRSLLDGIKGIGEKKKGCIFENISSIEELRSMTVNDINKIKGLSKKDAVSIYLSIHGRG
jgi:excinuclease ABC subunit C